MTGISIFVKNSAKNEIRDVLSGKSQVRYGGAIQAVAGYLKRKEGTSSLASQTEPFKEQEKKFLKKFVSDNNLWVLIPEEKNIISEGAEQRVFDSGKYILKTNDAIFYNSWIDYFHSLLLHNYFFEDTAYELIGFMEKDNILYAVVKQPYVKATQITDLAEVKQLMLQNGFTNTRNNDYFNEGLGIILEDLHEENVLTKNGLLYFIDTVFYLK